MKVVHHKYIYPLTTKEWYRTLTKAIMNVSIIWKTTIMAFNVIREWLVWSVGDGNKVRLGDEPWIGICGAHMLPLAIKEGLRDQGLVMLGEIGDVVNSTPFRQAWIQVEDIGFMDQEKKLWKGNVKSLQVSHVRLMERADELLWSINVMGGGYTPNIDYKVIQEEEDLHDAP